MVEYRIHRLKESARSQFRWAPHTAGLSNVKPKDYEAGSTVTAATPYDAWNHLKGTPEALQPGDVLESEDGQLRICKYVGFEEAQWQLPEVRTTSEAPAAEASRSQPQGAE